MPIEAFDGTAPQAVFDFLDQRLGDRGRAHWEWKYRLGSLEAPSGFYWRDDHGAILGFIGLIRTMLHGPGGPWPAAWFVDWQVVPDDRSVGVGVGLLRKAETATPILITLQGSADTRRMLPRLGWRESVRAAAWLRPLSGRYVGSWAGKKWASWLDAPVTAVAGAALALRTGQVSEEAGLASRPVDRLPAGYDEIWQHRCTELLPAMSRDRATIDWFCADYPDGGYRIEVLQRDGSPCGHLVTRTDRDSSGLLRGRIIDLVGPVDRSGSLTEAIALACRHLQSVGADYVVCMSSRSELDAALEETRFRPRATVPLWYRRLPESAPHPDTWLVSYLDCDRAYR